MRFLLLLNRDVGENLGAPSAETTLAMGKYADTLARAGALLAFDRLHEPVLGARVSFRAGTTEVVDGPDLAPREVVGAYWLLQVKSKEEAVEWARRCPCGDGRTIEIRRVVELSDYPPEVQAAAKDG